MNSAATFHLPEHTPGPSFAWLVGAIADPECALSLGAFGAVGQFPGEPRTFVDVRDGWVEAATATARIALKMCDGFQLIAFEMISSDPESWNHGVALCLPEQQARMSQRPYVTAMGPDADALDASERDLCCYDLGLETPYADVCVRPHASDIGHKLCAVAGQSIEPAECAERFHADTWIFQTALGRIETCHPERRHLIPNLLSGSATHANIAPIPPGLVPVGYVFPPRPRHPHATNAIDRHAAFQSLIDRYGDQPLARFKRQVEHMLDLSLPPNALSNLFGHRRAPTRAELSCIRVALRQRRWRRQESDRPDWERAFDRPLSRMLSLSSISTEG
ncbi:MULTISPECIES: DUF6925 family protein [unclassified Xanthobacter]|uniref:DUF6925 family protein n=1 Tax=unclassified Xanthobacter TaxID=2623496 RepID=UPI001EDF25CF|nr:MULTISPECIES: hypothetical protein [unclassified Xanthobacter]